MPCGGGNCGCGTGCSCGSSCGGCKSYTEQTTTYTLVMGFSFTKVHFERPEMDVAAEHGCKCGSNCTCDPCNCK